MKRQFLTKNFFEKCDMTSVNLEKTLEYLKIQETYSLKILQSTIYVKDYLYMFFYILKDIIQAQSKTNRFLS